MCFGNPGCNRIREVVLDVESRIEFLPESALENDVENLLPERKAISYGV